MNKNLISRISGKINFKILVVSFCIYSIALIIGIITSSDIGLTIDNNKTISTNVFYYLKHNLHSSLYLFGGLFIFSLSTLWSLFLNGFMLGVSFAGFSSIYSFKTALISIGAHGIFEIPAITFAGAVGLYPWYIIYLLLKNKKIIYVHHIKIIILKICLAILLFVIAAIMEALISPMLINVFGK